MDTHFGRHFGISLSVVLGSILIAGIALYYLSGGIGMAAMQIVAERSHINQETASLATFAGLKQDASNAGPYKVAMDQLLPDQDGLISFTQWFNTIASSHQVVGTVAFIGNPTGGTATTPGQALFNFTVTGTPTNIAKFIDDIQAHAAGFLLQVNSFELTNQGPAYQLTGQGQLFFRSS